MILKSVQACTVILDRPEAAHKRRDDLAQKFAGYQGRCESRAPKRVAIFRIRSPRFRFLILRMSLSRNRFPLSGDML